MNSSTSSSEAGSPSASLWRGWSVAFLASVVLATCGLLGVAVLLDPYDTGRSLLPLKPGLSPQGPRTAAASRGRDPAFQAAIVGNSHVQLLSPEALTAKTGTAFVSLAPPGSGPKEAFTLIDWFLRHHSEGARAIVVGLDEGWCSGNPALPNQRPFPFWLFAGSWIDYLGGLLRFDTLEELPRRLRYLAGPGAERARPNGYWDYTATGADRPVMGHADLSQRLSLGGGNVGGPFPAAERLAGLMSGAHADVPLILVRTPAYVTALPVPGSADAAADTACRAAFAELARRRPGTVLIDWRVDRAETRDATQFLDHTHYRRGIAEGIEADIATALARLR